MLLPYAINDVTLVRNYTRQCAKLDARSACASHASHEKAWLREANSWWVLTSKLRGACGRIPIADTKRWQGGRPIVWDFTQWRILTALSEVKRLVGWPAMQRIRKYSSLNPSHIFPPVSIKTLGAQAEAPDFFFSARYDHVLGKPLVNHDQLLSTFNVATQALWCQHCHPPGYGRRGTSPYFIIFFCLS